MERISSNGTLFIKLFLPLFWAVFFGLFTIVIFAYNSAYYGTIPGLPFRIGTFLFYAAGLTFLYFTFFQLKRVEVNNKQLYVTDYFKHVKYPLKEVAHFEERFLLFFSLGVITLKAKGSFGKTIPFIIARANYDHFWEQNPNWHRKLRTTTAEIVEIDPTS